MRAPTINVTINVDATKAISAITAASYSFSSNRQAGQWLLANDPAVLAQHRGAPE